MCLQQQKQRQQQQQKQFQGLSIGLLDCFQSSGAAQALGQYQ
jgi:hypothetical protein